jgi:putative colanic acid biosysnthesis UDP-glucose lipid carrier transferase
LLVQSLKKATMIVIKQPATSIEKIPVSAPLQIVDFRKVLSQRKRFLTYKRVLDVCFSLLVVLLIFSWLFPIIALLIKLTSRGPVFFVQKRVGFLGKSFNCIKFRTMVINREADTKQAIENDPRITKMGYFLRISNIDELPQFFNVLRGEMSIVGPRPHMHADCKNFSKLISNYKFRTIAKPGITGLAQVKGYRGPVKNDQCIFRRFQWDSFYVRNQDYKLEARIIGLTIVSTIKTVVAAISFAFREEDGQKEHESVSYQLNHSKYLN